MRAPSPGLLAVLVLAFTACVEPAKDDDASTDTDATVDSDGPPTGWKDSGDTPDDTSVDTDDTDDTDGAGGGGTGLFGDFQFPQDVVLLTNGTPNFAGAKPTQVSIDTVGLDYEVAYQTPGELIYEQRTFHLIARTDAMPNDLPAGESRKFWWTTLNLVGDVSAYVCRKRGKNSNRFALSRTNTSDGTLWEGDMPYCAWELVPVDEGGVTMYTIRGPSELLGDEAEDLWVLSIHAGATEGNRIRVDADIVATVPRFTLASGPSGAVP